MEAFGRHFILEMWDCNREVLNDEKKITQFLRNAANDAGATVVKLACHEFNPPGITAVAILAESHMAIHTWPVEGYVAVDIFTCGNVINPQLATKHLLESFEPKDHTSMELKRGSPLIKGTLLSEALLSYQSNKAPNASLRKQGMGAGREHMLKKDTPSRWISDYFSPFEIHKHAIQGTVYHGHSDIQEIVIAESECFGRCLILDNEFQSAELDEFVYHESLVQPALILHPEPKKVAIIGGGEGATLREVLRHKTVNKAVMVDLDEKVVECSKEYLPSFHNGSFSDKRTTLLFKDGRKFMEETDETFDAIIIDLTCPLEGGPSYKLFTKEFYELVRQKLTPQGLFSIQASTTSPTALTTYTLLNRTLKEVSPNVFPYAAYVPFFATLWGFCLVTNDLDPAQVTKEEIDQRISERIKGELKFYDGTTHQSIFNLPKYLRTALAQQTHVNRDNQPLKEKYPGLAKKG